MLVLEAWLVMEPDTLFRDKPATPGCGTRRARREKRRLDFRLHGAIGGAGRRGRRRFADLHRRADRRAAGAVRRPAAGDHLHRARAHHARVEQMLKPRAVPQGQLTERYKLVQKAVEATGYDARFRPLPVAVTFDDAWEDAPRTRSASSAHARGRTSTAGSRAPASIATCYLGCQESARNTLDIATSRARKRSARSARPLHMVGAITPDGAGYRVDFHRIVDNRLHRGSATASRVVVSAGSLDRPSCC